MKNVLVTAGGTSEPIDGVRSITNTGTGRLGSLIADELAASEDVCVTYVCSESAVRPKSERVEEVAIKSVYDLQDAVRRLCSERKIDAVIHSMAVSDYTVRAVSTAASFAEALGDGHRNADDVLRAMERTDIRCAEGKLSSGMTSPLILLERTPKVLPQFRELAPGAVIVGFKLLSNTTTDDLLDTALRLLRNNGCDYVLANDAAEVSSERHVGYLLGGERRYVRYETKREIAKGIAEIVTKEMRKRQ